MITVGSLFAGIGGFDLGLERAGMQVLWQIEKDDYRRRVLKKHWPEIRRYADVRGVHGPYSYTHKIRCNGKGQHEEGSEGGGESRHQSSSLGEAGKERERPECLEPVDLICGGFPCQPFSNAGKRKGKEDDRNLWPEFKRIIEEVRPRWIVAENVLGLRTIYLDTVLSDLEGMGYATETVVVPAVAVDAPHRRDRFWIVAYAERLEWSARPKVEGKLREGSEGSPHPDHADGSGEAHRTWDVADSDSGDGDRREHEQGRGSEGRATVNRAGEIVADSSGINEGSGYGQRESAGERGRRYADGRGEGRALAHTLGQGLAQREGESGDTQQEQSAVERDSDLTRHSTNERLAEWEEEGERYILSAVEHGNMGERGPQIWFPEPPVGRVVDGVPSRVDRLRALGDAVVPQVAEIIGHYIVEVEKTLYETERT